MNLILNRILNSKDLSAWGKLKLQYFTPPYSSIYQQVYKFYNSFNKLPSFDDLEVIVRDKQSKNAIRALRELEVPEDLSTDVLIQALINDYAQRETLTKLDEYLDEIQFKDACEIVEDLNAISLDIEEKTESSEQIVTMADFNTIDKSDILSRVPLGLNNDFDQFSMGLAPSEFMMIGGYRGSAKSVICANIVANQYLQGNSTLYFSIEMRDREIYNRLISILSGVDADHIKRGDLSFVEKTQIAQVRKEMFNDTDELYEKFLDDKDFDSFETKLRAKELKQDNQIITIDNSKPTLATIDSVIQTYRNKFKDKLKVVVVDYLNQINEPDIYKWDTQIRIAKSLKNMARKYDIIMVSPFQTDESGGVRFSKGILDAPDWVFNITPSDESIHFECKKVRGSAKMDFESPVHWDTLRILSHTNLLNEPKKPKEEKIATDDLAL